MVGAIADSAAWSQQTIAIHFPITGFALTETNQIHALPASLAARDGHVTQSHPKQVTSSPERPPPQKTVSQVIPIFPPPSSLSQVDPTHTSAPLSQEQQEKPAGIQNGLVIKRASSENQTACSPTYQLCDRERILCHLSVCFLICLRIY